MKMKSSVQTATGDSFWDAFTCISKAVDKSSLTNLWFAKIYIPTIIGRKWI